MLEIVGATDTGRKREHNEDAIAWEPQKGWAVLADGMGGHNAGEVASELAVKHLSSQLNRASQLGHDQLKQYLAQAIVEANAIIHRQAQHNPHQHNMGTTVVATLITDGVLTYAHVGDSRLYRYRQGEITQLTHDHSLVQELVDEGMMSRDEAAGSSHRNVITRALGLEASVEPDVGQMDVERGDLFLLCSDGLSDVLSEAELVSYFDKGEFDGTAQALVDASNAQGGDDNISLILLRVG